MSKTILTYPSVGYPIEVNWSDGNRRRVFTQVQSSRRGNALPLLMYIAIGGVYKLQVKYEGIVL